MAPRARCRGITLVELIVTIVVIAAAVSAVLAVLSVTAARSADDLVQTQAVMVAQSYLNEILQKPFGVDCAAACARSAMDEAGDYNGLVNVGAQDQTGAPVAGLATYTVQVSVSNSALGAPAVPPAQSELVTVRVTPPNGAPVILSGYRTSYP